MSKKMEIEIWSDILCPFCYIGKRKFEAALEQFEGKNDVIVVWKSYQLSPNLATDITQSIYANLAEHKGISEVKAKELYKDVQSLAWKVGLEYNTDLMVVANSFKAHRFSHLAKEYNKQNEVEELLFKTFFTDGKNIDNDAVLIQIGKELGFDALRVQVVLEGDEFAEAVQKDIYDAKQVGLRGVPHFVFNDKYSVSGAQDSSIFSEVLDKSFGEWQAQKSTIQMDIKIGKNILSDKK